ncbi:MAG TPA: lipopolysaccharide kinase InaA family protein, partial [Gemmataceae bacterium]|nr:lipopolysaccharide kinase InaA family protein [Gemmataceae bacterium]
MKGFTRMAFVEINPVFGSFLRKEGLTQPQHFFALSGEIVSGHPNRHVVQLTLGDGSNAIRSFMKREHRVRWKDRLLNAWEGFGLISKSVREGRLLQILPQRGINCPEWIAAGEDEGGRAFLVVRECIGFEDLRFFLRNLAGTKERELFLKQLGENLAQIHGADFNHPDLYSKHILVNPRNHEVVFLDWQRSRHWKQVPWQRRYRDLAALQATLADYLISPKERLLVFQTYFHWVDSVLSPSPLGMGDEEKRGVYLSREIDRLLRRRRIQEMRQTPLSPGRQNLLWLKGEALCVTPEFQATLNPGDLQWLHRGVWGNKEPNAEERLAVTIRDGRTATLFRRGVNRPVEWLWNFFQGKAPISPELSLVTILYRLQRFGIPTPKLLAFGQRTPKPWRIESFLLTEPPKGQMGLLNWLDLQNQKSLEKKNLQGRWLVIQMAAAVVRNIHAAGYVLDPRGSVIPGSQLAVQKDRN